ncbi:MAG: hypothetical protein H7318_14205 [Oligoflexus sp.]|nr:hypothetical protein [Oligoflexus sp.]
MNKWGFTPEELRALAVGLVAFKRSTKGKNEIRTLNNLLLSYFEDNDHRKRRVKMLMKALCREGFLYLDRRHLPKPAHRLSYERCSFVWSYLKEKAPKGNPSHMEVLLIHVVPFAKQMGADALFTLTQNQVKAVLLAGGHTTPEFASRDAQRVYRFLCKSIFIKRANGSRGVAQILEAGDWLKQTLIQASQAYEIQRIKQ